MRPARSARSARSAHSAIMLLAAQARAAGWTGRPHGGPSFPYGAWCLHIISALYCTPDCTPYAVLYSALRSYILRSGLFIKHNGLYASTTGTLSAICHPEFNLRASTRETETTSMVPFPLHPFFVFRIALQGACWLVWDTRSLPQEPSCLSFLRPK